MPVSVLLENAYVMRLQFIGQRMQECDPWRASSDAEFENACEAMEKFVMNRLYELLAFLDSA